MLRQDAARRRFVIFVLSEKAAIEHLQYLVATIYYLCLHFAE